jgi:hypothetical protein
VPILVSVMSLSLTHLVLLSSHAVGRSQFWDVLSGNVRFGLVAVVPITSNRSI